MSESSPQRFNGPLDEIENLTVSKLTISPELSIIEWSAVLFILAFLALLTFCVILGRYDSVEEIPVGKGHYLQPQNVEVYIEGAVKKPGSYKFKSGTLIKDALACAKPLHNADLKKIRMNSKLRHGQNILIPLLEVITITVSGAVREECEMRVPKGTRLSDLGNYLIYTEEADLKKMESNRMLKANEKIIVPVKGARRQFRSKKLENE